LTESKPFTSDFIQVYSAGYAFPPGLKDRAFLDKGLRNTATGKGMSAEQARASALCEALERYSGVYRGSENRRRARYAELADDAVHPNACMLLSPDQYERRRELNERSPNWIPEPFDATREVEWSPLWSLTHETVRYLPTACCYYGCPCPPGHDFGRADSNGCAAGNTVEEAILQGFMEVVERDAVALWWYNRIRRPGVDLASFDHPYFCALQEHYRSVGRRLWVLDITSDFGIPAFAALSLPEDDDGAGNLLLGFGAHFDPTIGVMRALTEMNQFLPSALRGRVRRVTQADLDDTSFLPPADGSRTRVRNDYLWSPHDNLRQDVAACVRSTGDRGMELLVLDQTRPDVGLPVVKVVVAGMRPFWGRFAGGRLYTVPVELGWLDGPTREEEMNPSHLVI
jgi:ribosomal protein S12 methylthiotransferase accessory factor